MKLCILSQHASCGSQMAPLVTAQSLSTFKMQTYFAEPPFKRIMESCDDGEKVLRKECHSTSTAGSLFTHDI